MKQDPQVLKEASRKIGIKLLDERQIGSTFPDYNRVLDIIENQRRRVSQKTVYISDHHYHLMHDNVIGIFGGRGSGKTSILFSLWERLRASGQEDILLPVISPELISDNCSILLWVLSMLEDTVNKLDALLVKDEDVCFSLEGKYRVNRPACERRQCSILKEEHQALLRNCSKVSEVREYDYSDAVEIQMRYSSTQYQLMRRLDHFWNLLAEAQRMCRNEKQAPLIFIMFDDIDLAPERSMELLMSAYKYFSNANVVIILTAAMKMLRQVLTCRMYEKVVGSDFRSLIQGNDMLGQMRERPIDMYQLDRASDAAIEYLNKVIPQSSRFFLERFDTLDRKQLYRYPVDWQVDYDPADTHSIPLDRFLIQSLDESGLLEKTDYNGPTDNFFCIEQDGTRAFAKEYYLLFGDKSRYLSNSCLVLMQTFEQLQQIKKRMEETHRRLQDFPSQRGEDFVREIYAALNNLLTTLISSHTRELEDCNSWTAELLRYRYGHHYLFINYSHLLEQYKTSAHIVEERIAHELHDAESALPQAMYEARRQERLREELLPLRRKTSVLFVMLNLLEHLTAIMAPLYYAVLGQPGRTRAIHGRAQLLEFLNMDALATDAYYNIVLFPSFDETAQVVRAYLDVLSEPNRFLQLSIWDSNRVADYFSYIEQHDQLRRMLDLHPQPDDPQLCVHTSCQQQPDWMRTVCSMLYLNKSGFQLLQPVFFDGMLLLFDDLALLPGLRSLESMCHNAIIDFASSWNLQSTAVQRRRQLYKLWCQDVRVNQQASPDLTWEALCGLLERPDISSYLDALMVRCLKHSEFSFSPEMDDMEFAQTLCIFVNSLHMAISRNIPHWPVKFRVTLENLSDVQIAIGTLSEFSPQLRKSSALISQKLYEAAEHECPETELDFYSVFRLMQQFRYYLQSPDVSMLKLENAWRNQYQPYLQILSLNLELVVTDGNAMQDYLNELFALLNLLPYYFSAQFLIANGQQYMESRVHADAHTAVNDKAAKMYLEYIKIFQPGSPEFEDPTYDILRKMMIEVHMRYTDQLMRKFGVIE